MGSIKSYIAPIEFSPGFKALREAYQQTSTLLYGAGTTTLPLTDDLADKNFIGWWLKSTATSGTTRGLYMRLYLSSGAGGECGRFFTTVESNTPADTVNALHNSLSFGSSAGNITGLGTGVRNTLHVPNRALNGTTAAVMAEVFADGASSSNGGVMSLLRAILSGNATGLAAVEDTINLVEVDGGTNASGNVVGSLAGNEPTWTGKTGLIRVRLNGTTAYLVAITL